MNRVDDGERWRDEAAVLPFDRRGQERRYEDLSADDGFDDGWGEGFDDGFDRGYRRDLGQLTMVVLMDDKVVDTVRRPVEGSGYECAALELGRGGARPEPRREVVHVPMQPRHELERTWLRSLVGGVEGLDALTSDPLPDEPLDISLVPADLRDRVTSVAAHLDDVAMALLGVEGRTACRRLLCRAVAAEPALLRGSDRDDIAAGAVVHAVAMANDLVGNGRAITSTALWTHLGLKSSPHDRARRFAHAVAGPDGVDLAFGYRNRAADVWRLGSADLLTSRFRGFLMRLRALADVEAVQPSQP